MAIFQAFAAKITNIENFDEHKVNEHEYYEIPISYGSTVEKKFNYTINQDNLKLVTIKIGRAKLVRCVLDASLLKLEEDTVVRIVYAGVHIAAVLSMVSGVYTFYEKPLYKKFSVPRIFAGLKVSICAVLGGYILHLLALHKQSEMAGIIFEGLFFFFFVGGIIYSIYHGLSNKEGKNKMERYLQRLRQ